MNQANFLLGYKVITMIIVLVTTKEKSLGTNFNLENWMLVIRLMNDEWLMNDETKLTNEELKHCAAFTFLC